MFYSSSMSNSNSALAASIVNEGRFEIDTYHRTTVDVALYNGHYYSGMNPGISFISVPFYAAGKAIFYLFPDKYVDFFYEKIDAYGESLPVDFYGNKKKISNYLPDLNKKQALEHIFISTFILPTFTTTLFSALSALFLYLILKKFTNNEKIRMLITLLYAFGTLIFPLSTEFFQRPIAVAFTFAAFFILFKIKHKEIRQTHTALFAAGLLAGLSVWFDYYHIIAAGLLFIYLLTFNIKYKNFNLSALLEYIIAVLISVLLILLYNYVAFDNPFSTPYSYRIIVDYHISGLSQIQLPSIQTIIRLFEFFLYSPIVLFALYGLYKAISKKDDYYHEALGVGIFFILTFIYATFLAITYLPYSPSSHKRYMLPIVPYLMIFLSYAITNKRILNKKSKIKGIVLIIGIISVFFNWTAAQYGGHQALTQYDLDENKFLAGLKFFQNGPSSAFLRTLGGIFSVNVLLLNLIGLVALFLIILLIWRPYFRRRHQIALKT